jgi:hypothetical protein
VQALFITSVVWYAAQWYTDLSIYGNLLQIPYWASSCGWALLVGSLVLLIAGGIVGLFTTPANVRTRACAHSHL